MKIKFYIDNLKNGKYGISSNNYLSFDGPDKTNIAIDKKSALEITYTLLDSLGLLDKQSEKLLDQIEERIEENWNLESK